MFDWSVFYFQKIEALPISLIRNRTVANLADRVQCPTSSYSRNIPEFHWAGFRISESMERGRRTFCRWSKMILVLRGATGGARRRWSKWTQTSFDIFSHLY